MTRPSKGWKLREPLGDKRPAWQFTRGLRSWDERYLRDPRRNRLYRVGVLAVCLEHPDYTAPLWLVVARSKSGKSRREPWYLLTNEPIETEADARRIVLAYARRWQIEMCFRYGKSELAWTVIVDDLEGRTHQVYGGVADPTCLIDVDGPVAFYQHLDLRPVSGHRDPAPH